MIFLRYLLSFTRLLLFAIITSLFIGYYLLRSLFFRRNLLVAMRLREKWLAIMLPILGIKIRKTGEVSDDPAIYMCNHISYIDPAVVLLYVKMGRVIGKSEVASWPVIGIAGEITGAIFLKGKA